MLVSHRRQTAPVLIPGVRAIREGITYMVPRHQRSQDIT
jgi:hypothetical protein